MRTRAAIASIVASTAVLVVGWDLGTAGTTDTTTTTAPVPAASAAAAPAVTSTPTPSSSSSTFDVPTPSSTATGAPTATASPAAPASTGAADGTYTGSAVSTRFGDVQVAITVTGGAITDVTALELTDKDNRSVSISNRAAPILRSEVLAAQTANVRAVSGATYTSDAYLSSLQAAIDQAGL